MVFNLYAIEGYTHKEIGELLLLPRARASRNIPGPRQLNWRASASPTRHASANPIDKKNHAQCHLAARGPVCHHFMEGCAPRPMLWTRLIISLLIWQNENVPPSFRLVVATGCHTGSTAGGPHATLVVGGSRYVHESDQRGHSYQNTRTILENRRTTVSVGSAGLRATGRGATTSGLR
jgi:hypothetical protein